MTKILIGIIAIVTLIFAVCTIVSVISAKENSGQNSKKAVGDHPAKQLCPKCTIGLQSYELDRHSEMCPYISSWKDGKCDYYVPLEKPLKTDLFKKS